MTRPIQTTRNAGDDPAGAEQAHVAATRARRAGAGGASAHGSSSSLIARPPPGRGAGRRRMSVAQALRKRCHSSSIASALLGVVVLTKGFLNLRATLTSVALSASIWSCGQPFFGGIFDAEVHVRPGIAAVARLIGAILAAEEVVQHLVDVVDVAAVVGLRGDIGAVAPLEVALDRVGVAHGAGAELQIGLAGRRLPAIDDVDLAVGQQLDLLLEGGMQRAELAGLLALDQEVDDRLGLRPWSCRRRRRSWPCRWPSDRAPPRASNRSRSGRRRPGRASCRCRTPSARRCPARRLAAAPILSGK